MEPSSLINGDEIPNTPRISLSDFDDGPARTEALVHMGRGDESLVAIGSLTTSTLRPAYRKQCRPTRRFPFLSNIEPRPNNWPAGTSEDD